MLITVVIRAESVYTGWNCVHLHWM